SGRQDRQSLTVAEVMRERRGRPKPQKPIGVSLFPAGIGYGEFVEHITRDDAEHYLMQTLAPAASDRLKDHLLICGECPQRLIEVEKYITAMRVAAAKVRGIGT